MRLASSGGNGSGGGGQGWVKSSKTAWAAAGEDVAGLRKGIRKALRESETGQRGMSGKGKVDGLECAAAQRELHDSWEAYVEALSRRCGELGEKLDKAGNHQYKGDAEIEAAFEHIRTKVEPVEAGRGGDSHSAGKGR